MKTRLTQTIESARGPQLLLRECWLVVADGPDRARRMPFIGDDFLIGTREGCQLALSDASVSHIHCELTLRPDAVRIRDLESSNGTFVNGVKIIEAELQPSDVITVGSTKIRFSVGQRQNSLDLSARQSFGPLLGRSLPMRRIFALLEKVAQSNVTVLVQGETGTGKDLVAQAIHESSPRGDGPFVVVDCAAIPAHLMEDELMGHERGAFTGADAARPGAFELAHGGTIFLDELGELPLELQPKLLRMLESRTVRRLGGGEPKTVDVRVVAATNRRLQLEVARGRFREDLFYRLNVIRVELPPLRDRPDDVPLIARAFLRRLLRRLPDDPVDDFLSRDAVDALKQYPWPGNVRELSNHVQRVVALADPSLRPEPVDGIAPAASVTSGNSPDAPDVSPDEPFKLAKKRWVERFEREYLARLLESCGGNVSAAARQGQIDRAHLYKLLRKYGLA